MIYAIEVGLILIALIIAFVAPTLGSTWFESAERKFNQLAKRRRLAVLVTGLTALAARAALLPILPFPNPAFHDEFCYLLAADTYAHGRLANPPHPMWIHFETFYVIWHPVYAAMFPPGQGLIMALGQVVLGHPFWGIWLSLGLMCAALTWMLQGWLPPKWALLGGILAIIRIATFSYWANSYWGGAIAATGGALVYGALPRLRKSPHVLHAILFALGLGILANSRPYEGLVISLPALAALLVWMFGKNYLPFRSMVLRVLLPAGLLMGITFVLMGFYNWKLTGSPWHLPHQYYAQIYGTPPYFLWQSAPTIPAFHHEAMRAFYLNRELPAWEQTRTLGGMLRMEGTKLTEVWTFYLMPLFTIPLLLAVATLPYGFSWRQISPGTRFLLLAALFGLAGYALEVQFHPHYIAPGTCLIYFIVLAGMRRAWNWQWRQRSVGKAFTRSIPVIGIALVLICAVGGPTLRPWQPDLWTWCSPSASMLMSARQQILLQLRKEPGLHLVIVRYSPSHQFGLDWVYNRADINASKVIWARDMGPSQNAELVSCFKGRRIWLVEPDATPPRLLPYPMEAAAAR